MCLTSFFKVFTVLPWLEPTYLLLEGLPPAATQRYVEVALSCNAMKFNVQGTETVPCMHLHISAFSATKFLCFALICIF